jgi:enamine deaminase RidA (YjgF/YER057c/UK114 family)
MLVLALGLVGEGVWSMQDRRVVAIGPVAGGPYSPAVVAGGLVYVSGLLGTGDDGKLVAHDIRSQVHRALARLTQVLEAAGSSLAQTASVYVYLARASDFEAMNAAYREVFADAPPVRTTVVAGLLNNALVEIAAIAVPNGGRRETLHPAGWMNSPRPYSYIVRTDDLVFLSGLVSRRGTDDQVMPGPIESQVKTILDNAGTLLRTAGLTYSDVVTARVFITDRALFEAMNDVYRKYFTTDPPARATAVTGLVGETSVAEITIVASTVKKEIIGPSVSPSLPLSTAVRAGRRVFLSGVLGNTAATAGNVGAQTRETLMRIGTALEAAGLGFADVVDSTVYLPDLAYFAAMNDVYRGFFPKDPPARATVGADLVTPAGLVEIMMTAVR